MLQIESGPANPPLISSCFLPLHPLLNFGSAWTNRDRVPSLVLRRGN